MLTIHVWPKWLKRFLLTHPLYKSPPCGQFSCPHLPDSGRDSWPESTCPESELKTQSRFARRRTYRAEGAEASPLRVETLGQRLEVQVGEPERRHLPDGRRGECAPVAGQLGAPGPAVPRAAQRVPPRAQRLPRDRPRHRRARRAVLVARIDPVVGQRQPEARVVSSSQSGSNRASRRADEFCP